MLELKFTPTNRVWTACLSLEFETHPMDKPAPERDEPAWPFLGA